MLALLLLAAQTTLSVPQPAYAGMPVWLTVKQPPPRDIRYPYQTNPWAFDAVGARVNLEVVRDGQPVPAPEVSGQRELAPVAVVFGLTYGSVAPPDSPRSRLPLHVAFRLDTPGRYTVRYGEDSGWLTFDLLPSTPAQRAAAVQSLLRRIPKASAGQLVGDILPSLLAFDDPRVLPAFLGATYHADDMVQRYADTALITFGLDRVRTEMTAIIKARGPSMPLARHPNLFEGGPEPLLATLRTPWNQAAVQTVLTLRWTGWGKQSTGAARLDAATLAAAPAVINSRPTPEAASALAEALGVIKADAARTFLWQMIDANQARGQALIALTWIANPADLPRLGRSLATLDEPSLAYALDRGYSAAAKPYLEEAARKSPNPFVRAECAKLLNGGK